MNTPIDIVIHSKAGPALTIAGAYATVLVGIRIITIVVIIMGPMEVRGPLGRIRCSGLRPALFKGC